MHPAAAHSLLVQRPSRIRRFVIGSVVGHVSLLVFGLIWAAIGARPRMDLDSKPIRATLVRRGKPRDEKLLPRKEELPPPPKEVVAPPAPPTPAPPAPEKVAVPVPGVKATKPTPTPAPQSGAKAGEDRRKRLFGAFDKTAKSTPAEDLEGAEDGDPDGDSATAEGERYYGLISMQVRRNYNVANTISEDERMRLKALVALRVGRSGEVLAVELAKSSGNDLFDSAVLSAVRRASPFSPPPDNLRGPMQKNGVVLEFRP